MEPTVDTLGYRANNLPEAFKRLLLDFKWKEEDIEKLFSELAPVSKNDNRKLNILEFDSTNYLISDLRKKAFAFVLKLTS